MSELLLTQLVALLLATAAHCGLLVVTGGLDLFRLWLEGSS